MRNNDERLVMIGIVEKMKQQEQMIKSGEYISWLYEFTKVNDGFTDQQWLYTQEGIDPSDYEKVRNLSRFFSGIQNYHDKNLIQANEEGRSTSYTIKYKDMYIEIGIIVGQGAVCFVQRLNKAPNHYVLYENIMNDVMDEKYVIKKEKLEKLELLVKEIKDIGVEYQVVNDTVKKVFTESNNS